MQKLDELDKELDGEGVRPQLVVNLDSRSLMSEGEEAHLGTVAVGDDELVRAREGPAPAGVGRDAPHHAEPG